MTNQVDAIVAAAKTDKVALRPDTVRAVLKAAEAAGLVIVPKEPNEEMWGGLARDLISWHSFGSVTPRALFQHLKYSGKGIPQWLLDEHEMKNLDHVPSAGTRAVLIYRAMIAAAGEQG